MNQRRFLNTCHTSVDLNLMVENVPHDKNGTMVIVNVSEKKPSVTEVSDYIKRQTYEKDYA